MAGRNTQSRNLNWGWLRNLLKIIDDFKTLDEITEKVKESFTRYLGFEDCQIFLYEKTKGAKDFELAEAEFFNRETIDEVFIKKYPHQRNEKEMIYPLEHHGRTIGLVWFKAKHEFNDDYRELLWSFVDQLAIKIANLRVPENMTFKQKIHAATSSVFNDLKGFLETSLDRLKLLEDQNKKLKEVDKVRTELINNVSHELRTPLVSIMGFSNVLQRHELSEELVQESSEQILSAGKRLSRMIDDLIQLNRAESQGWKVNLEAIDLGEIAVDVVDEFGTFNKKHVFVFDFPDNYPLIAGDKKLLRQVIDNLVLNAIKYSPDGGKIKCNIAVGKGNISLAVDDEGIGMREDEADKVFDRFYRAKNEKTEKIPGLGLGLAICRDIVETLNGELACESEYGKGSRFTMIFPYEKSIISD